MILCGYEPSRFISIKYRVRQIRATPSPDEITWIAVDVAPSRRLERTCKIRARGVGFLGGVRWQAMHVKNGVIDRSGQRARRNSFHALELCWLAGRQAGRRPG